MRQLENLLILLSDGRPTKEMIDKEIDNHVDFFQEKLFNRSPSDLSRLLFNGNATIHEQLEFIITCQFKHYSEVLDDVELSVQRYSPFIKINPSFRRLKKTDDYISTIHYKIPLIFEVTPELKRSIKAIMLQKDLDKGLGINIVSSKKQSKI
jgi:hypothetical protein